MEKIWKILTKILSQRAFMENKFFENSLKNIF